MFIVTGRGPYLGLNLPWPAPWAAIALDDLRGRSAHPAGAWHVPLGTGRLVVVSYQRPIAPRGVSAWPERRMVAILQASPFYRARVELELGPWSEARAELGIRPLGHWPPRLMPASRYYELAERALLTIALHMTFEQEMVA